jgi:DNA-binding response OmpR family regulator
VLIVESASVRNLIGAVLERERYNVLLADVDSARQMLGAGGIDLLISNEPWQFEPFPPRLRVLYVSGAPDREFLQRHSAGTVAFLQKPFRFQTLLLSVHLLLLDPMRNPQT